MSKVNNRFLCHIQAYYVKLDIDGVDMIVFVEVEDELEMSRSQIIERALLKLKAISKFQDVQFSPENVNSIELFEKKYEPQKFYKLQSYLVKFDTNTPVTLNANVYHSDIKEILTREEIIEEAIDYLEDIGITGYKTDSIYEIETLELVEASSPITPYMQTHVLEDWELEEVK